MLSSPVIGFHAQYPLTGSVSFEYAVPYPKHSAPDDVDVAAGADTEVEVAVGFAVDGVAPGLTGL